MKIGRNDPCPCSSGKKYKKCHLNYHNEPQKPTQNYFSLKGKKAEDVVQLMAEKTFLTDWCYKNPITEDGKELCDLLIVFGDIIIIWQIKNLKLQENGKYNTHEVEKNLLQLSGAKRTLLKLKKPIKLVNPRRREDSFNPDIIKEVYLISSLMGPEEEYFTPVEEFKGLIIHVFNREFTEISLNELDTINDFVDYIRAKETFIKTTTTKITVLGGEKELLAYYLFNERSFDRLAKSDQVMITEGSWEHIQQKPEYKAKKEADKISYEWDAIIDRAHDGTSPQYEIIAREMARLNRFERRYMAKSFTDAWIVSHNNPKDLYRRLVKGEGVTYCFLFMNDPEPRDQRKEMLFAICYVARGKFPENKKVLGIATEKRIEPQCSYDFCLFDKLDWDTKDEENVNILQKELGIFVNPEMYMVHANEYPKVEQ